jgi:two-component sensor histidine kinase
MRSRPWSAVDTEAADALRVVLLESVLKSVDRSLLARETALHRQNLLLAELDYRVRNALGNIEALVVKAAVTAVSVKSFSTTLRHRIQAMTQTHTLLAEGKWVGTSLRTLLTGDGAPSTLEHRQRMTLSGDDLFISPLEALALSVVLHELVTNALNHGALSTPQGAVSIHWGVDESSEQIVLRWEESGGAALQAAVDPSTGINLISRTIEDELHGTVKFDFAPAGLRCELRLPLGDKSLR